MKLTQNLKLKKPDYEDIADIEQLNENMDILDREVSKKASNSEVELKLNEKAPADHAHIEYLQKTARTQELETLEALVDKKAAVGSVYSKSDIDRMLRELKAQGITAEQVAQLITAQQILQKLKTVHGPGSGLEAASVRWTGVTGKPSSFPPTTHTHDYLGRTAKAADSELLDGHDSTYFATSTRVEQLFQLSVSGKQAHVNAINRLLGYNSGLTVNSTLADIAWWWEHKVLFENIIVGKGTEGSGVWVSETLNISLGANYPFNYFSRGLNRIGAVVIDKRIVPVSRGMTDTNFLKFKLNGYFLIARINGDSFSEELSIYRDASVPGNVTVQGNLPVLFLKF